MSAMHRMTGGGRREHSRLLLASELGARRAATRRQRAVRRAGLAAVVMLAITAVALLLLSCASRKYSASTQRGSGSARHDRVGLHPTDGDGERTSPAAAPRSPRPTTSERGPAGRGHFSGRLISKAASPGISIARNAATIPSSTRATTSLQLPTHRLS
jgi:hypothetical protein